MKHKILLALCLLSVAAFSQNNAVKTAGVTYTNGPPTIAVVEKTGSEIAIDTATGYIWQWHRTPGPSSVGTWMRLGQGIDRITGGIAPAYAPFRNQSWFAINADGELYEYSGTGTTWTLINGGGGGGGSGTVDTDATLSGDGSAGDPLKIAQQSAATGQQLIWTGTTWGPSWGNPYIFATTSSTISTDVNEVLIGTLSANITFGLPSCNSTNDGKRFKFVRNGTDNFSVTIDPSSTQTFYDGATVLISYSKLSTDCTCRFSGGTGVWFYDNF